MAESEESLDESKKGTHVNPWVIHVNVWQKPLQYYKVTSLQLIKIIGKKKKVKKESKKAVLKLNIQKTKIMASGPITSWQIGGKKVEIVTDFILGGLQNDSGQ